MGNALHDGRFGFLVRVACRLAPLVASLLGFLLPACGGSGGGHDSAAPFVVFDWRVVDASDSDPFGGGGTTVDQQIWKDDGSGSPIQLTFREPGRITSGQPSISPAGIQIVFVGADGLGGFHLFTMFNNGFGVTQITFGHGSDFDPEWSPVGDRIAFASDRTGVRTIWTIAPDGSAPFQVTHPIVADGIGDGNPSFSPDASRIVFERNVATDIHNIWVTNTWSGGLKQLTSSANFDVDPVWSPNGTTIAYATDRAGGGLRIYQIKPDGTGLVRTDPNPPGIGIDDFRPTWTADGSRIWFTSRFDPGNIQGDQSIHSMTAAGADDRFEEERLFPDEFNDCDLHP